MKNKFIFSIIAAVFLFAIISQVSAGSNIAFGKNYWNENSLSTAPYADNGTKLTDGNISEANPGSGWVGYQNNDTNVTIDLGTSQPITGINITLLTGTTAGGVYLPTGISVFTSDDNITFINQSNVPMNGSNAAGYTMRLANTTLSATARYIQVRMKFNSTLAGGFWMFLSEIQVNNASIPGTNILNSPGNNTNQVLPVSFNATVVPSSGLNLTNATLTLWNGTTFYGNTTISLSGSSSTNAIFTNSTLPFGNYTWNVFACWGNGAPGNCSGAANNYTVQISPYIINSTSYTSPISTATSSVFVENITTGPGYSLIQNTLFYNGTPHSATVFSLGGGIYYTTVSVSSASVLSETNVSFYWSALMSDGNNLTSTTYNQTVEPLPSLAASNTSCAAGLSTAMTFSLFDEVNISSINGTFNYNFRYGSSDSQNLFTLFGNITSSTSFNLCFNNTASNLTLGYGQISYTSPGMDQRTYYVFSGTLLSNITRSVSLYDLSTTLTAPYQFLVEDNLLNLYSGKYISLIRWYPGLNNYTTVDMGATDSNGNTILHAVSNDVDYRFGVYEPNGNLIYMAPSQRLVCSSNPCQFTLKVPIGAGGYSNFQQIQYNFTFSPATNVWLFTFSDPTQVTQGVNLTVFKLSGDSIFPVCSNIVNGYAGAVNCDTTGYSGELIGVAYQTNSGITIQELNINAGSTSTFSSPFGLWLVFLIAVPIAFLFAVISPIMAVVGGVLALVPAMYFGSVTWAVIGAFAVLGGIAIHMMRRSAP